MTGCENNNVRREAHRRDDGNLITRKGRHTVHDQKGADGQPLIFVAGKIADAINYRNVSYDDLWSKGPPKRMREKEIIFTAGTDQAVVYASLEGLLPYNLLHARPIRFTRDHLLGVSVIL